jgi:hypothetical protein
MLPSNDASRAFSFLVRFPFFPTAKNGFQSPCISFAPKNPINSPRSNGPGHPITYIEWLRITNSGDILEICIASNAHISYRHVLPSITMSLEDVTFNTQQHPRDLFANIFHILFHFIANYVLLSPTNSPNIFSLVWSSCLLQANNLLQIYLEFFFKVNEGWVFNFWINGLTRLWDLKSMQVATMHCASLK